MKSKSNEVSRRRAFLVFALIATLVAGSCPGVGALPRALLARAASSSKFDDSTIPDHAHGKISVSFEAEYPAYAAGTSLASAHSLLSVECPPWKDGVERPPLVLTVVMDQSGSMSGDKIRLLKKTTEFLVSRLSDKDKMGIVAYDDEVRKCARMSK